VPDCRLNASSISRTSQFANAAKSHQKNHIHALPAVWTSVKRCPNSVLRLDGFLRIVGYSLDNSLQDNNCYSNTIAIEHVLNALVSIIIM